MRLLVLLALVASLSSSSSCTPSPLPPAGPMPPHRSFFGPWDSSWGQMQLRPYAHNVVRGTFRGFRSGYISGKVDGDLLVFTWRQYSGEWGRAFLHMRRDGKLEGRWGYEKDPAGGGHWRAARPSTSLEDSQAPSED